MNIIKVFLTEEHVIMARRSRGFGSEGAP